MTPKKYLSGTLSAELQDRERQHDQDRETGDEARQNQMMAVFVLQPKRLIKKHDFKSLTVDGEKRDPHEPERASCR